MLIAINHGNENIVLSSEHSKFSLGLYRNNYCKVPKFLDTQNFAVIHLKFKKAKPEGILQME